MDMPTLRYRGSGWWLDAMLPRSAVGLTAAAFGVPVAWFVVGFVIAGDREAFVGTHDITGQLWFFPLHVVCVRLVGNLWADGVEPACAGLGFDVVATRRIQRGALGAWANLGALVASAAFIARDTLYGLTPDPTTGLIPFDDPARWDMAALGRSVHLLMLGLWWLEWLLFGYLLWLQLWILTAWLRELRRIDFVPRLEHVLVGDGYRHVFGLFSQTTTVSLVFALGNLAFIAYTGELIPREVVAIDGAGDFLREMSDLTSTALLFVVTLLAVLGFVRVLRGRLTRAVAQQFAAAGDRALLDLATPVEPTGDAARDVARLCERANAQADLVRAVVFQREVDSVGNRTILAMIAKAFVPLATTALKLRKVLGL
jgi:hypothetical protein